MCFLRVKGRIRKKKRMVLPKGPLAPFSLNFFCLVFWCGLVYSSLLDLSWPLLPIVYKISFLFSGLDGSCLVTINCNYLGIYLVYSVV